ncbi:MAG: hypothetical protein NW226_17485 [Microscillaceae bacterium]|nr:hypothetical protein [Microscillaceae bacterium]
MRKDVLLNDGGDLLIRNGSFVHGNSDAQHIRLLIKSAPGDWGQSPLIGVNSNKYIQANNLEQMKSEIINMLKADKYRVKKLKIGSDFEIDLTVITPNV